MLSLTVTREQILAHLQHRAREWQEDVTAQLVYAAGLTEPELQALSALAARACIEDLPHPLIHYVMAAFAQLGGTDDRQPPGGGDRPPAAPAA